MNNGQDNSTVSLTVCMHRAGRIRNNRMGVPGKARGYNQFHYYPHLMS